MAYTVQKEEIVPALYPLLVVGQQHFVNAVLVEEEMTTRLSFNDVRYHNENVALFRYHDISNCGTPYASSINPYSCAHNGRGAWISLLLQHAGDGKWKTLLKSTLEYFTTA